MSNQFSGIQHLLQTEDVGADMANKYLTFLVENQTFGLSIRNVNGIIQMQEITPVPELPAHVKGVINMRGTVVPIIDVNLRFGKAEQTYNERTCIIILETEQGQVGIIVDAVKEVLEIPAEDISPRPAMGTKHASYINGIGKLGDKIVLLLDSKLLVGQEMADYGDMLP
ncbi:MAG: chemotaxis protein CheW [Oscillospiraceae bacterium]|jgi:purine-binding chemotaxis protein CheW